MSDTKSISKRKKKSAGQINLSDLWNPAMNSVWNEISPFVIGKANRGDIPPCKYDELFLQGGRASGKSYFASVIVWLSLINDPKKNAAIVRKVGSSIAKSCWEQMLKVRDRLGLYDWKESNTKMLVRNKATKQQSYFIGLDDEEKARSITVKSGYLSIVWFEEAKQFKDMEEIDQAVSSILRGGDDTDDSSDDDSDGDMEYMTILTYNPPKSTFDWINREAALGELKPNRLTHKSTYLTMPRKWLGKKVLNEIEAMKRLKPEQYEHMYLGKVTGTGGEYFNNIVLREITDEEIASFPYFNMGIDFGYIDPNVFLKTYIHDGKMYIFDEIYQDEIPTKDELKTTKYIEFAKKVKEHTKDCPDDPIYCDAQDKGGMAVMQMPQFNIPVYEARKQADNNREAGYGFFRGLDEIVIDPKRCPNTAKAFLAFESMPAPGGNGWLDKPGRKNDHCPDAARYAEWENIRDNSRNDDDDIIDISSIFEDDDEESTCDEDDSDSYGDALW